MAVKVKVKTVAGEQEYTVTAANPTQPTSGSLTLDVDSPTVTVSGLTGAGSIQVWHATDGSDPTVAEDDTSERLENGTRVLDVGTGDTLIFHGVNIPA